MEGYRMHILVLSLAMLQLSNHIVPCTAVDSNTDYIRTSCKATRYPDLCHDSLQMYAPEIKNSPRTLALTALTVTLGLIKQSQITVIRLTETKGLTSVENQAMGDCVKQLKSTENQLQRSKTEFESIADPANSRLKVSNVQTWVSAALTDQNTCTDGFADHNLNGQVETDTANNIRKLESMTSIGLTLINNYATATKPAMT
ncbi:PREDICTED: 21 kDa protein-like [Fragaria vesca subsp. vesca]|uniref:21 kDa protein-like n=1 Tax=Fragaria vesca subsp. vesca TaxID=101020 RepID=UPI0002C34FA2|nr:PREDICTED: 21 kDa protein-like [Fragaria vesca subsp. vesca]